MRLLKAHVQTSTGSAVTSGRITTITAITLAELIIGGSLASMEIADEKGGTKRG
jgi:hypothetical protein